MKKIKNITCQLVALLCFMTGLMLSACSQDSASERLETPTPDSPTPETSNRLLRLTAATRQFSQGDDQSSAPSITRAVTYPSTTVWTPFTENCNMLAFIAKQKSNPASDDVISRLLSYTSASNDWQANIARLDANLDYRIFGFSPIDAANSSDNVSMSLLPSSTNYADGAQLTISGLKVLTLSDPCVIVGVTAPDVNNNYNLQWGKFDFKFKEGTIDVTDYIGILLDHIYSRYNFSIKIDADYAQLRTIRVTKMTLEALHDDGTQVLGSVTATVSIQANTTNTNPITSVTYSRNAGTRSVTIFDKTDNATYPNGIVLDKNATNFQQAGFCHAPGDQRWFRLTTQYEVFDRQGKHIRTNTAVNTFNTANFKGNKITSTAPGMEHTIQIVVNPTYLYMLSDWDLDNPTMTVN